MPYNRYRLEGDTRASEVEAACKRASRMRCGCWRVSAGGRVPGEHVSSPVLLRYQMETTPVTELGSYHSRTYSRSIPWCRSKPMSTRSHPANWQIFRRSAVGGYATVSPAVG